MMKSTHIFRSFNFTSQLSTREGFCAATTPNSRSRLYVSMSSADLCRGTVRWSQRRSAVQFATRLTLLLVSLLSPAYSSPVFPFTSCKYSWKARNNSKMVQIARQFRNTGQLGIGCVAGKSGVLWWCYQILQLNYLG
uniref:Uncharacterized protein n=1 Tax=Anopheles culicifacies TaxID=139723 RepID=A0A182MHS2_9DIPT